MIDVTAAGQASGTRLTDDGRSSLTWDGYWRYAVKVADWGYAVELAIPFKTMRYDANRTRWGIDFGRYDVAANEQSFWSTQEPTEYRVSRMGHLADIEPSRRDMHFEIAPALGIDRQTFEQPFPASLPLQSVEMSWFPRTSSTASLTTKTYPAAATYDDRFGPYSLDFKAENVSAMPYSFRVSDVRADVSARRQVLENSEIGLSGWSDFRAEGDQDASIYGVLRRPSCVARLAFGNLLTFSQSGLAIASIDYWSQNLRLSGNFDGGVDASGPSPSFQVLGGPEFHAEGPLDYANVHLSASSSFPTQSFALGAEARFRDRSDLSLYLQRDYAPYAETLRLEQSITLDAQTDPASRLSAEVYGLYSPPDYRGEQGGLALVGLAARPGSSIVLAASSYVRIVKGLTYPGWPSLLLDLDNAFNVTWTPTSHASLGLSLRTDGSNWGSPTLIPVTYQNGADVRFSWSIWPYGHLTVGLGVKNPLPAGQEDRWGWSAGLTADYRFVF